MLKRVLRKGLSTFLDHGTMYINDYAPSSDIEQSTKLRKVFLTIPSRHVGRRMFNVHQKFQLDNARWSFRYFDNNQQGKYLDEFWGDRTINQIFHDSKFGQMRSDIFRYCYLYDHGGVYIDSTKLLKVKLDLLFNANNEFDISFESERVGGLLEKSSTLNYPVAQYCLSQSKSSVLMKKMIEYIEENNKLFRRCIFKNPHRAILEYTGPIALMNVYKSVIDLPESQLHRQLGFDYHHAVSFSYPGSGYFKRLNGDYTQAKNQEIC